MILQIVKHKSPVMKVFSKREWKIADIEHYGIEKPDDDEDRYIKAVEGKVIVGMLHYDLGAGVMEIKTFIVSHDRRRQGIGKILFQKAEEIAKKRKIHKLILITGKNWEAINFYKILGFKKTGDLLNHFHHKDFILMTKFL